MTTTQHPTPETHPAPGGLIATITPEDQPIPVLRPAQIAAVTGHTRGYVSRVLRGERGISFQNAVKVAKAAGISLDVLARVIEERRPAAVVPESESAPTPMPDSVPMIAA